MVRSGTKVRRRSASGRGDGIKKMKKEGKWRKRRKRKNPKRKGRRKQRRKGGSEGWSFWVVQGGD